jgi:hypothetical protein
MEKYGICNCLTNMVFFSLLCGVQINLVIDGEKTSSLILPLHEINIEKLCQIRGQ